MEDRKSVYFSEEELSELIRQVEEKELLQAPAYLKRETMEQIAQYGREPVQLPVPRGQKRKKLTFYSLEVGLATAAAIVMLFLLPAGEIADTSFQNQWTKQNHVSLVERLGEKSNQLCKDLNRISDWLVSGDIMK